MYVSACLHILIKTSYICCGLSKCRIVSRQGVGRLKNTKDPPLQFPFQFEKSNLNKIFADIIKAFVVDFDMMGCKKEWKISCIFLGNRNFIN